jgi:xylose dehydrogenase (NAD/NADP)
MDASFECVNMSERDWQEVTQTDDPVRLAMVGLGWWTVEKAIPAAKECELCTVAAVVSSSTEKAESVAADTEIDIALTYDDFQSGEASGQHDAVYVATPNHTHLEYAEAAAKHGKHVLCEKPMEVSSDRARQMERVCDEYGVTLMVGYRMQTEPIVRRTRELLAADIVGDITQIHSHISIRLLEINPDENQWKLDPEAGGGATFGNGIYPINTTRFLLNEDPLAVQATTWSPDEPFADVDEHASFQLRYPGGIVASCTASHNTYDVSHLRILGTAGEVILEPIYHPWEPRTIRIDSEDVQASVTVEDVNQMVEEFEYFAHCLLTGAEPAATGEHGRQDIRIIEAVHKAAASGETQTLD